MLRLNPYRIGLRTIKTAVGMALGVIIAQLLGLDNYASSAILVVLCIKDTKIHSVHAIISRFISCLIAIGFGWAIFSAIRATRLGTWFNCSLFHSCYCDD